MKIAVDLDDVLTDTIGAITAYGNRRFHTQFKPADIPPYYAIWKIWPFAREQNTEVVIDFHLAPEATQMQPFPEACAGIAALKAAGHELFLVTGRRDEVMDETRRWIAIHFPNTFTGLVNTHHFGGPSGDQSAKLTKATVCKQLGASLLIEDFFEHALVCAKEGIEVLLLDKPWNQDATPSQHITRVFSWPEIVEKIKTLS